MKLTKLTKGIERRRPYQRTLKRKLISPENGLILYLKKLKSNNSDEAIVRKIQKSMKEMNIDVNLIANQNSRKLREWINGSTPSYFEAITLAKMNNIESRNLKKLFYADNNAVLRYFKTDVINLLNQYDSELDITAVLNESQNKYEVYQGHFNKKETVKNAAIIAISTVIFDIHKNTISQKRNSTNNLYKEYHKNVIPYSKDVLNTINPNSYLIEQLEFKLLNQIIIDSKKGERNLIIHKRKIKLIELSAFLNII